jgi:hypothetical protein
MFKKEEYIVLIKLIIIKLISIDCIEIEREEKIVKHMQRGNERSILGVNKATSTTTIKNERNIN